jgi:hypothetical protein
MSMPASFALPSTVRLAHDVETVVTCVPERFCPATTLATLVRPVSVRA